MTNTTEKTKDKKITRMFDIQKESERIAVALAQMEKTQKPGEASGLGTKTTILMQQEAAIKALHDAGYTVKQIATAISNDLFGILPKSITQLLNRHNTSREKQVKKATPKVKNKAKAEVKVPVNTSEKTKTITEIKDVEE